MNQPDPTAAVWIDGDPLHEAIAAAVHALSERDGVTALYDPRTVAAAVAAVARSVVRAEAFRDAEEICDEAGASYTAKALNEQADGAYALMERFRRKAEEAEQLAAEAQQPSGPDVCSGCRYVPCGNCATTGAQQQAETDAHPPQHTWRVETHDGEWVRGSHFASRPHAVERYETANRNAPLWRDGTPVQRRIVRETTTYIVETHNQPETETCQ